MAVIKIPYTYTKFENAPVATKADKTVQSGTLLMLFVWFFVFMPLALALVFAFPDLVERSLPWVIVTCSTIFLVIIAPFLFPFVCRRIWNKNRIAYRLAALEINRTRSAQAAKAFRMFFVKLALAVIIPWLLMLGALLVKTIQTGSYSDRMHQAFDGGAYNQAQGTLCTAYMVASDEYVKELLPKEIAASSPKKVGYILRITEGTEQYGYTSSINPVSMKTTQVPLYYRTYTIDWVDCKTGETVKTEVHQGNKPTTATPLENGAYYGTLPGGYFFEKDLLKTYESLLKNAGNP